MSFNRRGVSAVVASVLLILFVVVMISIVFIWAQGFVEDTTDDGGSVSAKLCDFMDYDMYIVGSPLPNVRTLEVVNRGNYNITSFDFRLSYGDGKSDVINSSLGVLAGEASVGDVDFGVDISSAGVFEIEIYPVLGLASDPVVCYSDAELLSFS